MKEAAVIIAPGFEEGEALTIIDIIRRAGIVCDSVGLTELVVTGAHDITMKCDKVLSMEICGCDMIVLPGGIPGATNQDLHRPHPRRGSLRPDRRRSVSSYFDDDKRLCHAGRIRRRPQGGHRHGEK